MEKYTLALCDDEDFVHNRVGGLLNKLTKIYQKEIILLHFYSIEEFIGTVNQIDCLLLDLEMPQRDRNGIAKKIWHGHRKYPIIILSNQMERYQEAFRMGAFRFLTKPLSEQDFLEAIGTLLLMRKNEKTVKIYRNRRPYEVDIENILYITSQSSHSLIYTADTEYRSDYSLKKWMETLNAPSFFQCHKSYIVNLNEATAIMHNIIFLSTGEKVPVGRRHKSACIRAMTELGISI